MTEGSPNVFHFGRITPHRLDLPDCQKLITGRFIVLASVFEIICVLKNLPLFVFEIFFPN